MDLEAVAGRALHVAQRARVRLEVDAMPRGSRDPFPLVLFAVALHVAAGADARRHFGMHRDLLGPIGDPEVELSRAGEDRLLMARVAAQRIMLGAAESLKRPLHDVAPGAEGVVVLHVIPAHSAKTTCAD